MKLIINKLIWKFYIYGNIKRKKNNYANLPAPQSEYGDRSF
jgi:hypothetical protein